ncbi:hypothetical protein N8X83_00140 [Alphaproteobacteria bacterium]|nr:hypothetical protein [Alphaproteobacteria bacterium]
MPIIKTEILGSEIEINYEEADYNKLSLIIQTFKNRLNDFPNNGRFANSKILFLTALKAESEIEDLKIKIFKNNEKINILNDQKKYNEDLKKEIILLKDQINEMNIDKLKNIENNDIVFKEIENLENSLILLQNKIKKNF